MRPAILRIGKVYERDGGTYVENWHFRNLDPASFPDSLPALLAWIAERGSADSDDYWDIEELREIAEQEAVLSLLPTTGEQ